MPLQQTIRKAVYSLQGRIADPWRDVTKRTRVVRDFDALCAVMGWSEQPILDVDEIDVFEGASDVNHRRLKDAQVIAAACRNASSPNILEIGTAFGATTAVMSANAPDGQVYTVNIPPESIPEGGRFNTFDELDKLDVGRIYREKKCKNIEQIFANTATWKPDLPPLDVAFIDGCHDAEFVYGDTLKVLSCAKPGTVIIWHDYNPELARVYGHIGEVLTGIRWLIRKKKIRGIIYHLQDSFTGVYVVPGK